MMKKLVSGIFATILVFAIPTLAFACNWGAKVSGDCQSLQLSVSVEKGNSEKAGQYEVYWSKDSDPREGQKIASGEIPALSKGEVHKVSYDLLKNVNGQEGNYVFHLIEPRGHIWSEVIKVSKCQPDLPTPQPANNGGDTTPPPADDHQTPPPVDNNDDQTPPPPTKKPVQGGEMPKTASSYPTLVALGAVLLVGGALTLRVQKQN